ncbi:permease-like protein, putative [Bodo saltans]|uniref:Permease-like protein, putative n=1 Tax=Bodo saltans TaxID=75058 RepID=A0A0S4JD81_BODSA|nr:permease-like protein, putative [Bodo saltans]|eukprot:CUG88040.1 permease-like protein, putative [Bodo saltans]
MQVAADNVDSFEMDMVPVGTPLQPQPANNNNRNSRGTRHGSASGIVIRSIQVGSSQHHLHEASPTAPFATGLTEGSSNPGSNTGAGPQQHQRRGRNNTNDLLGDNDDAAVAGGGSPLLWRSDVSADNYMPDGALLGNSMRSRRHSSFASSHDHKASKQSAPEMEPPATFRTRFQETLNSISVNLQLSAYYTRTDIKRRPRNCAMGFVAVFLVVFFTMIVLTSITKTSYLLLRFAELSVGEMDAVVYSNNGVPVVNYTAVRDRFEQNASSTVSGSSPRWIARGVLRSWSKVTKAPTGNTTAYDEIPSLAVNIMVVDAEHEPVIGLGRNWPYRQIGYGEAQVTDTALDFLGIRSNIGDRSNLVIQLGDLLSQQSIAFPSNVTLPPTTVNVTTSAAQQLIDALQALAANTTLVINGTTVGNVTEVTVAGVTVNISNFLNPTLDFNIADGITEPFGKYPTALGNVMLMDYHLLPQLLSDQSCASGSTVFTTDGGATQFPPSPTQFAGVQDIISNFDMTSYALLVVAMFKDRFNTYYKGTVPLGNDMIHNSNEMLLALDYRFAGDIIYPVAVVMEGFQSFTSIITSVFAATVIIILVLSAILVYSLLGMNSEERQFELAMIRAQGMTRTQLFYIMSGEMVAFVIPGVICGVGLAIAANAVLEKVLSNFVKTPYEPLRIPAVAYAISIIAGFLMPVVSNWTPVMESMRASLRDALDINRQKWSETQVSMMKLEDLGLELWQSLLGLFLAVAGFMVYYLLPMSFLYNNLLMFFLIMNIILLIMLFGLCLIVFSLQGVTSQIWLWLLVWGSDVRLKTLISKNMEAHTTKNQRAFVMFILAIASVIFGGIAFQYLADALTQTLQIASGADLLITSTSFDVPLNKTGLDAYLNSTQAAAYVASWSYVTFALDDYPQVISAARTGIQNILGSTRTMPLVAVTENYLETVFPEFVAFDSFAPGHSFSQTSTGVVDVVRNLYTDPLSDIQGQAEILYTGFPNNVTAPDALEKVKTVLPILVASGVKASMGLDTNSLAAVGFTYLLANGLSQSTEFLVQPRALLNRLSGFPGISPRRFGLSAGAAIMSVDSFKLLVLANETDFFGVVATSSTQLSTDYVAEIRYEKLLVRVKSGISSRDRTFFLNSLQSYLNAYYSSSTDVAQVVETVNQVANLLFAFFYFSAAICVLLASFMTWMVFVSNVTQNAWSFGVLRSLGFTKAQVLRAVVYEALVLVMSSFTLGLPIGIFVGFTLGLQMSSFLNLPFTFIMPYPVLLVLFGISIVATVLGSAIPMRSLNKLQVAIVVKKYN